MDDLSSGMDARIGASRSKCLDWTMGIEITDRCLKNTLNTASVALSLPT